MTRVEGDEQVHRLAAADLADHDPIGAHPQGVADEVADRHLAGALDAGGPALEPDHVRLGEPELGGVLDRDHPLAGLDEGRQRVEHGRLARAGAAADDQVAPCRAPPPRARRATRRRTSRSSRSSAGSGRTPANRLIETAGPSTESGGMTTLTREPSGSRPSAIGLSSSTRRPIGPSTRSITSRRPSSPGNDTSVRISRPRRSIQTSRWPLTRTSSTSGSRSSSSSGPRPTVSRRTRSATASRPGSDSSAASASTRSGPRR